MLTSRHAQLHDVITTLILLTPPAGFESSLPGAGFEPCKANCSLAPSSLCAARNRSPCSSLPSSCGDAKPDYVLLPNSSALGAAVPVCLTPALCDQFHREHAGCKTPFSCGTCVYGFAAQDGLTCVESTAFTLKVVSFVGLGLVALATLAGWLMKRSRETMDAMDAVVENPMVHLPKAVQVLLMWVIGVEMTGW
jgi:hypothetical protein